MQIAEKFLPGIKRQLESFDAALAGGMPRRGWKIAINVPEVLRHLDLSHSGIGWLDGHRVLRSGDHFTAPDAARLLIEPEVAIQIAGDVPRGCSLAEARASIGALCPALEIVDYAKNPGADFDDVVAGCMFHSASVLGMPRSAEVAQALGTRWPLLTVGETRAEAPRKDLVPADLAELVTFASAFLAEFDRELEAGDIILSGSYTARALEIGPGQEAIADHGPLGKVSVRIAD
jgi:2-oxo-3-hexenedioate decarboxylase/2-keto-4-pentenoate hydratase